MRRSEAGEANRALFGGMPYSLWYRRIFEAIRAGAECHALFDSSIVEPTGLLHDHIRRGYDGDLQSRFVSTFGWGSPRLVASIAQRYGVSESMILATTGCTSAMSHVYAAYLGPGTHVVIETPHFDLLSRMAESHLATVSYVQRETGTNRIDPEELAAQLRPNTRLVVITNAHNPSGTFLGDAELLEIAAVAGARGIPVLVDEVYADFVSRPLRRRPAAALDPCFISINSLTKVYGLSALKCGWIIASPLRLEEIRPVYAEREFGSSKIAHGIASLVLDEIEAYDAHWQHVLACNRSLLVTIAAELREEGLLEGEVPEHGCIFFPRLSRVQDTQAFAAWAWERYSVGIAPGEFFGAPGYVRIGFGLEPQAFAVGIEAFARALRAYC